jgi:hypothetical protein
MSPTAALARKLRGRARAFRDLLDDPGAAQVRQLRTVLERNAGCEYARRFDFAGIAGYPEYRRRVPVVSPDELRPWVDRMARGEPGVLLDAPLVAFEETGGSSGGAKLVPYSEASLEAFRRALLPWLDDLYVTHPGLAMGTAYWSISPACRERRVTAGGVPIGLESDAAYLGPEIGADLLAALAVPPETGLLRDIDAWRELTARHLLADENLALISVWSPTFLLELLRYMKDSAGPLARGVPDAGRGRQVEALLAADPPRFDALWPRLQLISCWDHAGARSYAAEVRRMFPAVTVQGKGLLATEGVVSIPLAGYPMPVLAIDSGFFEFVDAQGEALPAHEVRDGAEYELLLTNDCGLYRYAIGDRVRVHGFAAKTPMLEFIGRSGVVSDLCGEKITEEFALHMLAPFGLRFAALAPQSRGTAGYVLLLDAEEVSAPHAQALGRKLDEALGANPQYAYARSLRQLAPLAAVRCERPLRSWIDAGVRRGQRLGDIKPCALLVDGDWPQTFRAVP